MLMAVTRPIMVLGVTLWRKVVDVMVQIMGPKPNKKYAKPATETEGNQCVDAMTLAASTEKNGPNKIARPKGIIDTMREAINEPAIIPTP